MKLKSPAKTMPTVIGAVGPLVAVDKGTGRYPYRVMRAGAGAVLTPVSQTYSSEAEVLADLRLRSGRR